MASTASDATRARELYKYYRPPDSTPAESPDRGFTYDGSTVSTTVVSSPDTALTAYAQLVAWRLKAHRAMISLIDEQTQYFVAEATKTLNLVDNSKYDEGDSLWVGCTSVSKSGRLCEVTLQTPPKAPGQVACFMVSDLSKEPRFNQLEFVQGPPYLKFYAGTPIITEKGISIGSLFIVDESVRDGLTDDEIDFMGAMAKTIMKHLETTREAAQRKRGMKMAEGLSRFVEVMTDPNREKTKRQSKTFRSSMRKDGHSRRAKPAESRHNAHSPEEMPPRGLSDQQSNYESSTASYESTDSDAVGVERKDLANLELSDETYQRASVILRESLELDGLLIYDGSVGFLTTEQDSSNNETNHALGTQAARVFKSAYYDDSTENAAGVSVKAGVLGHSTLDEQGIGTDFDLAKQPYASIGESTLQYFFHQFPRGKLWTLDDKGLVSSSDEEHKKSKQRSRYSSGGNLPSQQSNRRESFEFEVLRTLFPGARQVLFAKLRDPASHRPLGGCFGWTTNETLIMSKDVELGYLNAFLNNVCAEVGQLQTAFADNQKTKFISSISHELRSPLHGILGATEFLRDTTLDEQQISLAETVESCSRTLLDTINSVLDYSKINAFERNSRHSRKTRDSVGGLRQTAQMLSATALPGVTPSNGLVVAVDLAVLCEEVCDGTLTGFVFSGFSPDHSTFRKNSLLQDEPLPSDATSNTEMLDSTAPQPTTIVVDIKSGDWQFFTEPGAIRRIMMNIIGNSLKYTPSSGCIKVKLEIKNQSKLGSIIEDAPLLVELSITDNGKGISTAFMKQNLFTPFAQESTLSTGLGLGMSMVRSIVNALGGAIDVKSEVGRGTEVVILLKLRRPPLQLGTCTTPLTAEYKSPADFDHLLSRLQKGDCKAVAVFGFEKSPDLRTSPATEIRDSLINYLVDWFKMEAYVLEAGDCPIQQIRVVLVNEPQVEEYLEWEKANAPPDWKPRLVLLHDKSAKKRGPISSHHLEPRNPSLLSKPFGPMKLAKSLLCAVDSTIDPSKPLLTSPNVLETSLSPLDHTVKEAARKVGPNTPYFNPSPGTDAEVQPSSPTHNGYINSISGPGLSVKETIQSLAASPPIESPNLAGNFDFGAMPVHPKIETVKRSPRVLLVDDNLINLNLINMYMKKRKCSQTEKAEDGHEAVECVKKRDLEPFDVIFMDLSMPIMSGFEATRAIRKHEASQREKLGPDAPSPALIIALTGLASSRDQQVAFESGVDRYLTKPVKFTEIGRILDKWEKDHFLDSGS